MAAGQSGLADPEFDKIPFDNWLKGGQSARIRWSMRVFPANLEEDQRLHAQISAVVEGDEFAKRDKRGELVYLLQIRDHDQRTYRSHRVLTLRPNTSSTNLSRLKLFENVCVVPGDYEIAAAVYDRLTGEHNLQRAKLHVPEFDHDPTSELWNEIPTVEFQRACRRHHLSIPLKTAKPVRIEVIANRPDILNSHVQPRLRLISEMKLARGSVNVTLLDLARREVRSQGVEGALNERPLWAGLAVGGRYSVDARALKDDGGNAQFFVGEVRKILERPISEPARVLIVLSDARKFTKGEDLRPIQVTGQDATLVFYIRCVTLGFVRGPDGGGLPPGPDSWSTPPELPSGPPGRSSPSYVSDSLDQTLKPLHPRVFVVATALQFRKALRTILSEVSRRD